MRIALLALAALLLSACSPKPGVRACLLPSMLPFTPGAEAGHRAFAAPVLTYAAGETRPKPFGYKVGLDVAADGRIACYRVGVQTLSPKRRSIFAGLTEARYRPFVKDGKPVPVTVILPVYEQRAPARHVPPPQGAPETFAITLQRGGCFGACPAYEVTIHGDGRAVYNGQNHTLFEGHHESRVSAADMDRLREAVAAADVWSLDDSYWSTVTDSAPYRLSISLGGTTKTIEDYVGDQVGIPLAVRQLEGLVDEISGARAFVHGDATTADRLAAEHYDFTSAEAAKALLRLSATAPAPVITTFLDHGADPEAALEGAAESGRADIFALAAARVKAIDDQMLCALQTRAAGSGNAALFMSIAARSAKGCDTSGDLTELYSYHRGPVDPMSGQTCPAGDGICYREDRSAIARYLLDHGADPFAASVYGGFAYTQVEDLRIRQMFLDKGFDLNRRTASGGYVLTDDTIENEALFDLDHGADPAVKNAGGETFADHARSFGWWRVRFWLWRHGGKAN